MTNALLVDINALLVDIGLSRGTIHHIALIVDAVWEKNKMTISEKKMQIVIDNYFKSECDVNTSIRQAFEKGFRIGIKKVPSAEPQFKKGKWIHDNPNTFRCSECNKYLDIGCGNMKMNFCPNCEADMRGEQR